MAVPNKALPDLFAIGFGLLRKIGLHPKTVSLKILLVMWYFIFFATSVSVLIATSLQVFSCTSLNHSAMNITLAFAILQTISKGVVCILYKKELNSIANHQLIWDLTDIADNELLHNEIVHHCSFSYKSQRLVRWLYFIAASQRIAVMFLGHDEMPLMKPCTIQRKWFWYAGSLQAALVLSYIFLLTGIDLLFVGACSSIVAQFKIANHIIQVMDYESPTLPDVQKIFVSKYIKLSNFVGALEKVFSSVLLVQYASSVCILCTQLYVITQGSDEFIKASINALTLLVQAFIYCFLSEHVSTQAANLNESVYNSNWYNNLKRRNSTFLILTMAKTQKPVVFTAHGLFDVNLQTYANILKLSWTYYCVLKVFGDKND